MDVILPPAREPRSESPELDARGGSALRSSPPSGPVLFARYAFGPNRLGLCGPEDWRSLLELATSPAGTTAGRGTDAARTVDRGLRDLAGRFEGAFPYLRLIADAHGIADPLDRRVVEGYWIGNVLSDCVDQSLLHGAMASRFRPRVTAGDWRWLEQKPAAGAHPTHAFHVFDVFPRLGGTRGTVGDAVGLKDSCRIRWGRVRQVAGEHLVVDVEPLRLIDGRLTLGQARPQLVRRWLDGTGFVTDVAVGDDVSIHWDWACEVLEAPRLEALRRRTLHQLALANQTL
jgi:hypothetical protein